MGTVDAFFYGLYMDAEVLRAHNVKPVEARVACLRGYGLDLRGPAKVVRREGDEVWGVVYGLSQGEVESLYAGPTGDYRAEDMVVFREDGRAISVRCYNQAERPGEAFNEAYLVRLIPVCRRAGLPDGYVAGLERMGAGG